MSRIGSGFILAIMMHIPHFVGEVQLCVEFLQRERMDMGRVQEEVIADVIQFVSRKEVAVCGDLDSTHNGVTTILH